MELGLSSLGCSLVSSHANYGVVQAGAAAAPSALDCAPRPLCREKPRAPGRAGMEKREMRTPCTTKPKGPAVGSLPGTEEPYNPRARSHSWE